MKNQKLAVAAALLFLALLIGVSGCRRNRNNRPGATSSEQPAVEVSAATAAAPTSPTASVSSQGAAASAPHPGEALDPVGIKVAMDQFQRKMQRPPNDWQEMIDAKVIPAIPKRKDGQPLNFSEYIEFSIHRAGKAGKP